MVKLQTDRLVWWGCTTGMDTKTRIIEIATKLFQQKGYIGVGLSEILKACNISKGSLYHHFPNGKEELLIACLESLNDVITQDIENIFNQYPTTKEAINAMIDQLIVHFETEGTIAGYTFSSIVSEMASLSEPVRHACSLLYAKMQSIYTNKLVEDGFSTEAAESLALTMVATVEGGMMLCLTQKSSFPLKTISLVVPNLLQEFQN